VLEYCAKSELHLATARLGMLKGQQMIRSDPYRTKSHQPTTPVMADYLYANQD
jgi:hypothetical protein